MDSRLKVFLVLLVGTVIGAVVAGGAISYVNGSDGSVVPSATSAGTSSPYVRSAPDEGRGLNVPISPPREEENENGTRNEDTDRSEARPLFGSAGPTASVTASNDPAPSEKPKRTEKRPAPVIEEEAEPPKVSDNEGGKDGDGGSVR